eukprot:888814-Rhodomonas_salina.1
MAELAAQSHQRFQRSIDLTQGVDGYPRVGMTRACGAAEPEERGVGSACMLTARHDELKH